MKDNNNATVKKTKVGRPKGCTTNGRMTRLENVGMEKCYPFIYQSEVCCCSPGLGGNRRPKPKGKYLYQADGICYSKKEIS